MVSKIDKSVYELWDDFTENNSEFNNKPMPKSWHFCDNKKDADECAELVIKGIKQATSTSMWWFKTNNHKIPKTGDIHIITNWEGKAKAIIQTSKVDKVPYNKITKGYAKIEGEGDKSLEYWRKTHWDYYTREMKKSGQKPTLDMIIICEQFKTIWTKSTIAS